MMKPIDISLRLSQRLLVALAIAHLLALVVIWVSSLAWTAASGLSALVGVSALLTVRRSMQPQIVALRVNVKGEFSIQQRDGVRLDAVLLGTSFVSPYLTVLNLRLPGRRWPQHVVLTPDVVQADAFRQLRVWLRWGRAQESA